MQKLVILMLLLPISSLAQPPNQLNNPNLGGYQNPTQQRLQTQMQTQQQQQQNTLNQQLQSQSLQQQQQLNTEIDSNSQRVMQSQPGMLQQQPNSNGLETLGSQ